MSHHFAGNSKTFPRRLRSLIIIQFRFMIRARKIEGLKNTEKGATLNNDTRGALRIATAMVGLPFGIVPPIHHERRSLFRIRGACFLVVLFLAFAAFPCFGQQSPDPNSQGAPSSTPADGTSTPAPPPMPSMSGPLTTAIPHEIGSSETVGKLEVTGILSGVGWTEGNHITGDSSTHWDVSNAQIFVQKTTGWWQFYLQGGAYNLPAIGVPFLSTADTVKNIYGPFPQGYLKLVKGNFNVEVGALPTLIGAEYTFSFENMNIERGLLWNQENAVNQGVQVNYTAGPIAFALTANDGMYSSRLNWLWGSAIWTINSSNFLAFVGGGNLGHTGYGRAGTSVALNNEEIYNVIYTYTSGPLTISPY